MRGAHLHAIDSHYLSDDMRLCNPAVGGPIGITLGQILAVLPALSHSQDSVADDPILPAKQDQITRGKRAAPLKRQALHDTPVRNQRALTVA